jgi:hypothetical protein
VAELIGVFTIGADRWLVLVVFDDNTGAVEDDDLRGAAECSIEQSDGSWHTLAWVAQRRNECGDRIAGVLLGKGGDVGRIVSGCGHHCSSPVGCLFLRQAA